MTTPQARQQAFQFDELDVVRTKATIQVDGATLPSGSLGAIVLVHRDGRAYEVEFTKPVAAVLTLYPNELEPA